MTEETRFSDEEVREALDNTSGNTTEEKVQNAKEYLYRKEAEQKQSKDWSELSSVDQWKHLSQEVETEGTVSGYVDPASTVPDNLPLKHQDQFKQALALNPELAIDPRFKEMEKLARRDWSTYYSPSLEARKKKYGG